MGTIIQDLQNQLQKKIFKTTQLEENKNLEMKKLNDKTNALNNIQNKHNALKTKVNEIDVESKVDARYNYYLHELKPKIKEINENKGKLFPELNIRLQVKKEQVEVLKQLTKDLQNE